METAIAPDPSPPRRHHPLLRVTFIVVSVAVMVVTLGSATYGVTGLMARKVETQDLHLETATGGGIQRIVVRLDFGSLTIRGTERSDVDGQRIVTTGLRAPAISEQIDGTTLRIEGKCPMFETSWCGVSYVLDVPSYVIVDADTGTGSIQFTGIAGAAHLESGAGSITVERSTGPLDLLTGGGSVRGTDLGSRIVAAESGAGSVRLAFAEPPDEVKVKSGAGSVDVEVPLDDQAYAIRADAGLGDVDLAVRTAEASTRHIDAEAGAGSVRVHYPQS